jgi:HSP20 family protein
MEREVNRLFGEFTGPRGAAFPPINIYTNNDGATVTAELPGIDPKDLDITVQDRSLVLRGERKAPEVGEDETWHRRERAFGQFTRSVELPFAVDSENIEATYRDGILEIELHRSEADKPKKITVQS